MVAKARKDLVDMNDFKSYKFFDFMDGIISACFNEEYKATEFVEKRMKGGNEAVPTRAFTALINSQSNYNSHDPNALLVRFAPPAILENPKDPGERAAGYTEALAITINKTKELINRISAVGVPYSEKAGDQQKKWTPTPESEREFALHMFAPIGDSNQCMFTLLHFWWHENIQRVTETGNTFNKFKKELGERMYAIRERALLALQENPDILFRSKDDADAKSLHKVVLDYAKEINDPESKALNWLKGTEGKFNDNCTKAEKKANEVVSNQTNSVDEENSEPMKFSEKLYSVRGFGPVIKALWNAVSGDKNVLVKGVASLALVILGIPIVITAGLVGMGVAGQKTRVHLNKKTMHLNRMVEQGMFDNNIDVVPRHAYLPQQLPHKPNPAPANTDLAPAPVGRNSIS